MFKSDTWLADVVAAANADDRFGTAAEHFDGSVTLAMGEETAWLKLYRGEIIDTEPYVPQFGATFALSGSADDWRRLAAGETSLSESLYDGSIRTRGNKLEANRIREALELFVRHLQSVTSEAGE